MVMSKNLIIVESPAKVKTIKKFLGSKYMVQASVGHIRDLPSKELGVDEESFLPRYVTITGKEKVVQSLQEAAAKSDTVYLAPDPDREGEAIAWHIAEIVKDYTKDIKRIQFNEITAKAVKDALDNPRTIDPHLFEAQQARRILDRLVGYKISPLLWKSVKRGISAGRVQSVALRLVVEREEERLAFIPEEYWNFKANCLESGLNFRADLTKINDKKVAINNEEYALAVDKALKDQVFLIENIEEKERSRNPQAPFTTSTLQQAASQRLGFGAKRTMSTAQRLYEGIDIEGQGAVALITYMRTDSVRIADEARDAALEFIEKEYGKEYLVSGGKGRAFKGKKSAQDAHEAVRPVDVNIKPLQVKSALTPDQYRLYSLIWTRFVASQMAPARFHDTNVTISCENAQIEATSELEKEIYPFKSQWKTKGIRLLFDGFLAVYPSSDDKDEQLPTLKIGQEITVQEILKEQKFTQPSPRYTEASLVRELEEQGIGRPSTYATIISTIQDREYVRMEDKHFVPTDLGNVVCFQLRDNFPRLMDIGFTAAMENDLDKVADGELGWDRLLKEFSVDFNATLAKATVDMKGLKGGVETSVPCPTCGKNLAVKFGKSGEFLACSGYPDCRYTSNFTRDEKGEIQLQAAPQYEVVGQCPKCAGDVILKKSHTGSRFLACSNYPKCDYAAPYSTGVPCPRCDEGMIVEKSSRRGKLFYSCSTYPKCDYALWDMPVNEPCPQCESPFLVRKHTKTRGDHLSCPECKYTHSFGDDEEKNVQALLITPPQVLSLQTKKESSMDEKSQEKTDGLIEGTEKSKKTRTTKKKATEAEEKSDSIENAEVENAEIADKPKKTRASKKKVEESEEISTEAPEKTSIKASAETKTKKASSAKAKKPIDIFTDGSCLGNPGAGGYGAILSAQGKRKEISAGFVKTTNNRMEMRAVIEALKCLKEPCAVNLYTDSQYVIKAIRAGWLDSWQKNGWKTSQKKDVKNKDLWEEMLVQLKQHNVEFNWVKGHAGHPENERCDELARNAASGTNLLADEGFEE